MSQSVGCSGRPVAGIHRRRRWGRSVAMTVALLAGLAACGGDDDDAADSTSAPETTGAETTAVGSTAPPEITAADTTAATEPSGTDTDTTAEGTTPEGSEPETAGPDGTGTDTTEVPDGAAVVAVSESSDADDADAAETTVDDATEGSFNDVGPTTTGPACEFAENTSLPLERCDMGPAVAVVQSILQADGYEVGIDGNFGDQTLYALRAFQEAEGLTVDGVVGLQTWSELGVDEQFGNDANGDGVIAPDELDLTQ
jgi:hypothetical protein